MRTGAWTAIGLAAALTLPVPAAASAVSGQGRFVPVTPVRILDTATGLGTSTGPAAVPAHATMTFSVAGRGGLPSSGVTAVALNVTTAAQTQAGYVTVYPAGAARPTTSSVNFAAGNATANAVLVQLGAAGKVSIYNASSGAIRLVADASGYFTTTTSAHAASFVPVTPARILDTGSGTGAPRAAVPAHATMTFSVAGQGGLPSSGVTAVALNVTTAAQTQAGYVTVYPAGAARPTTSSVNFAAGNATANAVLVQLGAAGKVSIYNASSGAIRLVADASGYFTTTTSAHAASFVPVTPARILDTATGLGTSTGPAAVPAHAAVTLTVAGPGGLPSSGVTAVALNVTAAAQTQPGYVTVYPAGAARPTTSSLNFTAGNATANAVLVQLGAADAVGHVTIYNGSNGTIRLVADVTGYFTAQPAWTATAVSEVVTPEALTCLTASTCTAVGNVPSPGGWVPAVMTVTDGAVTQTTALAGLASGENYYDFNGVSCPSSDTCTAVGEARDLSAPDPQSTLLIERLAAGKWTTTGLPVPPDYHSGSLASVSCADADNCVAVGSMGNPQLELLHLPAGRGVPRGNLDDGNCPGARENHHGRIERRLVRRPEHLLRGRRRQLCSQTRANRGDLRRLRVDLDDRPPPRRDRADGLLHRRFVFDGNRMRGRRRHGNDARGGPRTNGHGLDLHGLGLGHSTRCRRARAPQRPTHIGLVYGAGIMHRRGFGHRR